MARRKVDSMRKLMTRIVLGLLLAAAAYEIVFLATAPHSVILPDLVLPAVVAALLAAIVGVTASHRVARRWPVAVALTAVLLLAATVTTHIVVRDVPLMNERWPGFWIK